MASLEEQLREQFPIFDVNFEDRADLRLASQYQESEKFKGEVKAFLSEVERLKNAFLEMLIYRTIDHGQGIQLDVIGEIVGQPRVSLPIEGEKFFGYQIRPPAPPTGNLGYKSRVTGGGGRYRLRSDTDQYAQLSDLEYKLAIRARIFANYSYSSTDDFSQQIFSLFNLKTLIINAYAAAYIYFLGGRPSESERILLNSVWTDNLNQKRDFLPSTLGVRRYFIETSGDYYFGYAENPMSRGYGVGGYAFESDQLLTTP